MPSGEAPNVLQVRKAKRKRAEVREPACAASLPPQPSLACVQGSGGGCDTFGRLLIVTAVRVAVAPRAGVVANRSRWVRTGAAIAPPST